jgi:ELWxxDGT repeat protein
VIERLESRRLLAEALQLASRGAGDSYSDLVVPSESLVFFSPNASGLWVTDGKASGTKSLNATIFDGLQPGLRAAHKDSLYFVNESNQPSVVNGHTGQVKRLPTLVKHSRSHSFSEVNGRLFYAGFDDSAWGWRIFLLDDATNQFQVVIEPSGKAAVFEGEWGYLFPLQGKPTFVENDGELASIEIRSSAPPVLRRTASVRLHHASYIPPQTIGEHAYLFNGRVTFRTDGTQQGTDPLQLSSTILRGPVRFQGADWIATGDGIYRFDLSGGPGARVIQGQGWWRDDVLATSGDKLFFFDHRGTLFATDGTAEGTTPVDAFRDIEVSGLMSGPAGRVIVVGGDKTHGVELWTTDGTTAGTKLFDVVRGPGSSNPDLGLLVGNDVYFSTSRSDLSGAINKADASAVNRRPVARISAPLRVAEGGVLRLDASTSFDPDKDLLTYRWDLDSDGQYDDLTSVRNPAPTLTWEELKSLGVKDGPTSMTVRVQVSDAQSSAVSSPATMIIDDAAPVGSVRIPKKIVSNTRFTPLIRFTDFGLDQVERFTIDWGDGQSEQYDARSRLLAHQYTKPGRFAVAVTITDEDGTHPRLRLGVANVVSTLGAPVLLGETERTVVGEKLATANGSVLFVSGGTFDQDVLWVSNGTTYGTHPLLKAAAIYDLRSAGKLAYFLVTQDERFPTEWEMWRTDGTKDGTWRIRRVKQELTLDESFVHRKRLYFRADASGSLTRWLSTDGTASRMRSVTSSNGGTALLQQPVALQGTYYFLGRSTQSPVETNLYKLNGQTVSEAATVNAGFDSVLHAAGKWLFITRYSVGETPPQEAVIWRSDGTAGGTIVIRDIQVTNRSISFVGTKTLMVVASQTNRKGKDLTGQELWAVQNDGRARLIRDINPGADGSDIRFLQNAGGLTYFTADDGTGVQLWRTNGTSVGTVPLPLPYRLDRVFDLDAMAAVGKLLYFTLPEAKGNATLFRTDGTPDGTIRVTPITLDVMQDIKMAPYGQHLLFVARAEGSNTNRFWISNGTPRGTNVLTQFTMPLAQEAFGSIELRNGNLYLLLGLFDEELYRIYPKA